MTSDEIELRRASPRSAGRRPMPGPGVSPGVGPGPVVVPLRATGPLDAWAGLDPTGLAPRAVRLALQVPGVATLERRLVVPFERRLLDLVAERVQSLPRREPPAEQARPRRPEPRQRLAALVEQALDQTPAAGREELYAATLARLVPDEVRILALLADGGEYPLVAVRTGLGGETLLRASPVGRAADVVLPERTGLYLANLAALDLVRVGPSVDTLRDGYRRLLDDPQVTAARAGARRGARFRRARIERHTLRISDFGRELWDACRPTRATRPH